MVAIRVGRILPHLKNVQDGVAGKEKIRGTSSAQEQGADGSGRK